MRPEAVVVAVAVLGAGCGCCRVYGLLEVRRPAGPDDPAGLTAVYQAVSYLGFAAPYLLAQAQAAVPASALLLRAAGLAVLTSAWTTYRAAVNGGVES